MNVLLAQFIPEARDLLEQAGTGMLALEQDVSSQSMINDVFRAVHTLKGSSGLFDVMPLTRLVHAAEDLLGEVRTGELELNSDIVDQLLDSLDLVGQWIDALEAREQLPGNAEASMAERVAILRGWLAHRGPASDALATGPSMVRASDPPDWLADLSESGRMSAFMKVSGRKLLAWNFIPEENCFFRGDDPIKMVQQSPGLLALRVCPGTTFPSLDLLDPLTCLLRFEVLSDTSRESLEEHMRYVAECVDIREIDPSQLAIATGDPASGPVFTDFTTHARRHIQAGNRERLDQSINTILTMVAPECLQASALRWCKAQLECYGFGQIIVLEKMLATIETGCIPTKAFTVPSAVKQVDEVPQANILELKTHNLNKALAYQIAAEQIRVLETPADPAIVAGRLESVAAVLKNLARSIDADNITGYLENALSVFRNGDDLRPLRELIQSLESGRTPSMPKLDTAVNRPLQVTPTLANISDVRENTSDPTAEIKAIPRVLRIDQAKIDSIMNLVAELIVAKNGLSYLANRAEQVHGSRAVAREIKDQFSVIDRITQGLQVSVMSVRMMPVSQVFQRFPRLVRDISRKLGKKIELVIEGEDTEADKNVLESLADPLIHMVRNSLDHGIETPEERLAAGKSEHGTLNIIARQENDFVVIEVRDDGKGIDLQRVKIKSLQLGLISAEKAEQMSDQEAANLVFLPGFSTKEEVSDLSGRGVGMDVVRSAVLKANGDVTLRTTMGAGTSVTVRLPLTMAVSRIVTIECRGRIFGIPMDLIVETVKINRNQIHRIKDFETFVLRETIIPIVRLANVLGLADSQDGAQGEDEAVMVVRIGRGRVGLVVDGFRERLEAIVKPLEGILEGMPGFSGTALLGDGRVLLILDLQEIL
jgi:two-component system chemotaxis sensor kinase CheA